MQRSFDNLPVAVCLVPAERSGRISYVNPQFERLLGFSAAEATTTTGFWERQTHPGDRDRVFRQATRCKRDGVEFEAQYRMLTRMGDVICVQDHARLFGDAQGGSVYWLGVLHDVTTEMRSEAALRENEARYRELVENMSDGVAVYQVVGDGQSFLFKQFNRAAEKISGLKRKDVIGKDLLTAFPGVKEMGLLDVFIGVWRTGQPQHHPIKEYRDSRISLWVDNYVFKLPSGEVVAIFEDITEKTRVAEALKVSEERLRNAQEYAGLGYWELLKDRETAIWSKEVFRHSHINTSGTPSTARVVGPSRQRQGFGFAADQPRAKIGTSRRLSDYQTRRAAALGGMPWQADFRP